MNDLFEKSVFDVRNQIHKKLDYSQAYYGRSNTVKGMITDMDNFPYVRYFRGQFNKENPVIFNREAGYRPIENPCYAPILSYAQPPYTNYCWQTPCSTVYPCRPPPVEQSSLNILNNRNCIPISP